MPPDLPFHDPAWLTAFTGLVLGVLGAVGGAVAWVANAARKSKAAHAATREALADVRHEITNSHTVNLRDDLDGKHDEIITVLNRLDERLEGLRDDHRQLTKRVDESASEHREFRHEARELRHDMAKLQARVAALGNCAAGDDH